MIEFTVSEYPAFLLFSPIISKEHYSAMTRVDNPCTVHESWHGIPRLEAAHLNQQYSFQ